MKNFLSAPAALTVAFLLTACTSSGGTESEAVQSEPQSAPVEVQSTEPEPLTEEERLREEATALWESWDLRTKAASLLVLHYPGVDTTATAEFVRSISPAGLILMGDNIPDPESTLTDQAAAWQDEAAALGLPPLIISIDQEGGLVSRVSGDPGSGAGELRDGDPERVRESFAARANYLERLGINVNFGVVADYTDDPNSFIYGRVMGTNPDSASAAVAAAVEGERDGSDGRVRSTVKHFPGHGIAPGDSHETIPECGELSMDEWSQGAARPFKAGVDAGTAFVMVGHIGCSQIAEGPASISAQWYEILRDELAFDGMVITDDMSMLTNSGDPALTDPGQNAVDALAAGTTLVLSIGGMDGPSATQYAEDLVDAIVAAVEDGTISQETFDAAGIQALVFRAELEN